MPNNDDILFDEWEDDTTNTSDISLDSEDETNTNESEEEIIPEDQIDKEITTSEDEEEEIDLDSIFADIDDAKDIVDKIEEKWSGDTSFEISQLKESLNNMQNLVKRLSNEKADLTYKVAEIEAFWSDSTDPKILLLSRNLTKAQDWDEKSKTKAISVLKDMLYDLTWEDYDQNKIDKDIDLLSAVESYNSSTNPNLKTWKKEEDDGLSI